MEFCLLNNKEWHYSNLKMVQVKIPIQATSILLVIINLRIQSGAQKMIECPEVEAELSRISENYSNNSAKTPFWKPYLHRCFRSNSYDISQIPVRFEETAKDFSLQYSFDFYNLLEVSNKGSFSVVADMQLIWKDYNRIWNRSIFPVSKICVPSDEVWTPSLILTNCEDDNCRFEAGKIGQVCLVNDGSAWYTWERYKLTSSCDFNFKYFPFDSQECRLIFLFFPYYAESRITFSSYKEAWSLDRFENDEWFTSNLYDSPINLTRWEYQRKDGQSGYWSDEPFNHSLGFLSGFVVKLSLSRISQYYQANLIAPVILLSLLGLFAIFLPGSSQDKLNLEVGALLGFLFLQSLVAQIIPQSHEQPLISKYILAALIISVYNLIASMIILIIETMEGKAVPKFVRILGLNILGTALRPWKIAKLFKGKTIAKPEVIELQEDPLATEKINESQKEVKEDGKPEATNGN